MTMKISTIFAPLALAISASISVSQPALAQDGREFATPAAAVEAVISALHARSASDLIAAFGSDAEALFVSDEPARDRAIWSEFLERYDAGHFIHTVYGDIATLFVGNDNWAFPIPIVLNDDGMWVFDIDEAREEILSRRIGRNELDVIDLMQGYVAAQRAYRSTDQDGDGVMEFASSILSSEGQHDGLYWSDGESPIGDFMAQAAADGYAFDGQDYDPVPYAGYYYRLLTSQGDAAPGGAMDYIINGNQIGGHAMLAVPADYGDTGIMSFMVSENGTVMQADLGPDTLEKIVGLTVYDPADGWFPVSK